MAIVKGKQKKRGRRFSSEELKQEAVQMLLDGHSAPSVAERLGLPGVNSLYRWEKDALRLTGGGFAYLALMVDLGSRRIVGWSLAEQMTETLVLDALQHAIRARQPPADLIHHSDRGGQNASRAYRDVLRRALMRQSMSRAANCYDNAFMESCFGTIKTELEMTECQDSRQARHEIASYLACYNAERRHSSLDYLSPVAFEAALLLPH
jgi:putative transposase